MVKMGIIGPGSIAGVMAKTVKGLNDVELYGIAGRDEGRARAFAAEYGVPNAYPTVDDMLKDQEINLVYVAVPHSHHYVMAKKCLEAGKNVLCEKAFTVTADQAQKLFDLAEEKHLLIAEAIWTRYMPSRKIINDIIESGEIGTVTSLTANLGYDLRDVPRLWDKNLAGGALLDLGVYLINLSLMVFGNELEEVSAVASFSEEVDMIDSITMIFEGGEVSTTQANASAVTDRNGSIFGTDGYIEITNINNPQKIVVYDKNYKEKKEYPIPPQITGYEYEVEACVRAIENGEITVPEMPPEETVFVMQIMDAIREGWKLDLPEIDE